MYGIQHVNHLSSTEVADFTARSIVRIIVGSPRRCEATAIGMCFASVAWSRRNIISRLAFGTWYYWRSIRSSRVNIIYQEECE